MRRGVAIAAVVALVFAVFLAVDFHRRTMSTTWPDDTVAAAIVFTGGAERVEDGLTLWRGEQVALLFVTGANSRAGMHADRFADRFALSEAERAALQEGRITLAPAADDTIENALESRCWQSHAHPGGLDRVVLITAPGHMPRASVALERMLPGTVVLRQTTRADQRTGRHRWLHEFPRYFATRLLALLPERWLWVRADMWCDKGVVRHR